MTQRVSSRPEQPQALTRATRSAEVRWNWSKYIPGPDGSRPPRDGELVAATAFGRPSPVGRVASSLGQLSEQHGSIWLDYFFE